MLAKIAAEESYLATGILLSFIAIFWADVHEVPLLLQAEDRYLQHLTYSKVMSKSTFYLFFYFLFISCNSSHTNENIVRNSSDTLGLLKADTVLAAKKVARSSNMIDSMDKANSSTITDAEDNIQKASVSGSDSSIWLTANMKLDHRIFGYEKPDTASRKMILISIFTNDVEGNPFKCPFGSYYETGDMTDMQIKYVSTEGKFIKANVFKNNALQGTVYMDKKWIEFEE